MGISKSLCEKIKAMSKDGVSIKEIAKKLNLKESTVLNIIKH